MLLFFADNSSTLKIEGVCPSETSVKFYQIIQRHISEDNTSQTGFSSKNFHINGY
jgi:hypothetical protein